MKYLFFFGTIFLLIICQSCSNKNGITEYVTDEEQFKQSLTELKESQSGICNDSLPYGFKFGMSEEEVYAYERTLRNDTIWEIIHSGFKIYSTKDYNLQNMPSSVECIDGYHYYFSYENGKMNKLNVRIDPSNVKSAYRVCCSLYGEPSLYLKESKSEKKYAWVKGNQEIILNIMEVYSEISYYDYNNPIDLEAERKRKEEINRRAYVANNEYDGSVKQVVTYLKENLKDPNSYESISWSKVMYKENYYLVRHKYRARNSLGAYVVEYKTYYIDLYGKIYRIEDFNN